MSNLRNNQQQRERNVNNLGRGPRQNGGAGERAQDPINPPVPHGNVVVNPVFANPAPPLGNNIVPPADPPRRNNRVPPVNVAPRPQRRRGRRGGNIQILPEVPLVQFPAIVPPAFFPPPAPPPAFVQPIIPIQVPSVLLQPPPVQVQPAFFPPVVPQHVVPVVQQPPPFRQQPFLNLDPDLFPPRPNVGSMEPASWNRPPPPPPRPPGVAPGAPIGPRAPQGPPSAPQGPPLAPQGQPPVPQGVPAAPQGQPPAAPQGPPAAPQGQPLPPQGPPPAPQAPPLQPSLPLPAQHGGGFGAHSAMWAEAARHQLRTVWTRAPGPPPAQNHRDQRAEGDAAEFMAENSIDQGAERQVAEPVAELNPENRIERELNELVAGDDDVDERVEAEAAAEPENEQDSVGNIQKDEIFALQSLWKQNISRGERVHPSLHANFDGSYFIILANRVTMELSVNHCMRLRFSDVTVFMNGDGSVCSITHANVRMVMNRGRVAGIFTLSSVTDQTFIAGDEGILFTASNLDNAYLVTMNEGISSIPLALLNFNFDSLNEDITSIHFRHCARIGRELFAAVRGIVEAARTYLKRPWKVNIYAHGQFIRYVFHGEVVYRHGARTLHYSRRKCFLNLKTPYMDMTITYNRQIEMKFGNKRIHVSRTGIMVADGARTATMDHFGRLISRT
ncbi:hypothetical protein Aduo_019887 [Ancylostoma duodenale]